MVKKRLVKLIIFTSLLQVCIFTQLQAQTPGNANRDNKIKVADTLMTALGYVPLGFKITSSAGGMDFTINNDSISCK